MAQQSSKTTRRAVRAGTATGSGLTSLGEQRYLVPLNRGRHAYVRNLTTGKTRHVATDSASFIDELRSLAEGGHADKLRAELDRLAAGYPGEGWDLAIKRLVDEGVFGEAG